MNWNSIKSTANQSSSPMLPLYLNRCARRLAKSLESILPRMSPSATSFSTLDRSKILRTTRCSSCKSSSQYCIAQLIKSHRTSAMEISWSVRLIFTRRRSRSSRRLYLKLESRSLGFSKSVTSLDLTPKSFTGAKDKLKSSMPMTSKRRRIERSSCRSSSIISTNRTMSTKMRSWTLIRPANSLQWIKRNQKFASRNWSNGRVSSIVVCRPVRNVAKNSTKKKTTTGAVAPIRATSVAKCGGAVAKQERTHWAANMASMRQRMMKMTKT